MPPRKIRRTPEERALRAITRMSPGTAAGRIESASPVRRDAEARFSSIPLSGGHTHDGAGEDSTVVGGVNETGATAALAPGLQATAVGDSAEANGQEATALGNGALADLANNTALGSSSIADTGNNATASGAGARARAGSATAFGASSLADENFGSAFGAGAEVHAPGGTALGRDSFIDAGHDSSVALGNSASTTDVDQVAISQRHIELEEMAAPTAGAANSARLFVEDNGAGKTRLMVQFATGAAQQIAIEPP